MRERFGGGTGRVRGARLMASGLPEAKWNNADVTAADVDVAAVRAWYAERDVPWGVRVPVELDVELGEPVFVKRCVALLAPPPPSGIDAVVVRRATPDDDLARLDHVVFGGDPREDPAASRAWVAPERAAPAVRHWVAEVAGVAAGIATVIRTDGDAGMAAYMTAFGVVPGAPDDGVLDGLVRAAAAEAFASGAAFVHANPDDEAWQTFAALGAVEVAPLLVRVVRA